MYTCGALNLYKDSFFPLSSCVWFGCCARMDVANDELHFIFVLYIAPMTFEKFGYVCVRSRLFYRNGSIKRMIMWRRRRTESSTKSHFHPWHRRRRRRCN